MNREQSDAATAEDNISLLRGVIVVAISYLAISGVATAFEAGRLLQPEVAYFMLAGLLGVSLGLFEIVLSPSVGRAAAWIRRSVMNRV